MMQPRSARTAAVAVKQNQPHAPLGCVQPCVPIVRVAVPAAQGLVRCCVVTLVAVVLLVTATMRQRQRDNEG